MRRPAAFAPVLTALALIAAGLGLRRIAPGLLSLPRPATDPDPRGVRSVHDAAVVTRDSIAGVMPDNLTHALGRTLILTGGALLAVRLLDLAAGEDEMRD